MYIAEYLKMLKHYVVQKYINGKTAYYNIVNNINKGLLEDNICYDLVLENWDIYIANNTKATKSFKITGHVNQDYYVSF